MKLYIYEQTDCAVSGAYHSGGGVVICTDGDPQNAWAKDCGEQKDDDGKMLGEGALGEPDRVIDVPDETPEFVTVFPNQGCC